MKIKTPERVHLVRETYATGESVASLVARLNQLPGGLVKESAVRDWARDLDLKRTPEYLEGARMANLARAFDDDASELITFKTPARIEALKRLYPADISTKQILEELNQLPGATPVNAPRMWHWAKRLHLVRSPEAIAAQRLASVQMAADKNRKPPGETVKYKERARPRPRTQRVDEWHEETASLLRVLWAEGHKTAEIGRRLRMTKCAIIGKARRLGLGARPSPIKYNTDGGAPGRSYADRQTRPYSDRQARPVLKYTLPDLPSALVAPLSIVERAPRPIPIIRRDLTCDDGLAPMGPSLRPCQWVVRDGSVIVPWVHCGVDRAGWPYCADHKKLAHARPQARSVEDAAWGLGPLGAKRVTVGAAA